MNTEDVTRETIDCMFCSAVLAKVARLQMWHIRLLVVLLVKIKSWKAHLLMVGGRLVTTK